jgi:hypothetical protein
MKKILIHKRQDNQDGFVSIVVCMIIMVILSMVTIGFAQLMGREQRQALDRQLSMQAFYAAESGVNDAVLSPSSYSSTCSAAADISADGIVKSTCVFTDKSPKTLVFKGVGIDPKVFPIRNLARKPTSLNISWTYNESNSGTNEFFGTANPTVFPTIAAADVKTGVARVFLTGFTANDTAQSLSANTGYVVLSPVEAGGANPTFASISSVAGFGSVISGNCSPLAHKCTVAITGVPVTFTELYMSISSLYAASDFTISASDAAGLITLEDVQIVIDSTGKTNDVLRRIEVRKSLLPNTLYSGFALNGGICKLWTAAPATTSNSSCPGY